jgi:ribonucleoside-diphosphate reductase alpha chain
MEVVKRNGESEEVSFDKIKLRINKMANLEPQLLNVDPIEIAQKVIARIYDKIKTVELDEETASICTSLITKHPDYSILGSRIIISNSQKNTNKSFQEKLELLVQHNIMTQEILDIYNSHKTQIDETIDYERDFNFDYFGYKTLEKSYLQKVNGVTIERIQDLLMRVSLGIHKNDIDNVLKTYDLMSSKYFIHASPTLYNAGTPRPQLLSCFLIGIDDSIGGIYKCLGDCAAISKWAGGIGLHVSNIRGNNSYINGTNGKTSGIVPMLRVFNSTARYVNQCFLPDTPIYTQNGLKTMEDIACGDKLVTNDGSFQEVLKVYNDTVENKNIVHIQSGVTDCRVTDCHPFLVVQNQKKGLNYNTIKNRLNNNYIQPEYIESRRLTTDDFMCYPIPKYTHDIEEYTEDDCYMYGLMLGDGHITKNKTEYGITLNQTTKKEVCDWVKTYLDQNILPYWICENKGAYSIRWSNCHRNKFQRKMLYDNEDNKIIHTSMLHLPTNKIWNILLGLIHTDGGVGKEIYYYSSSKPLIQSIMYLLMKVEILPQMSVRDRIGESHYTCHGDKITTKQLAYQLRIPKTSELCEKLGIETGNYLKFLKWGNYLMSRIKSIKKESYTGDVIEFDINKNHNYLTPIGLAHNGGKRLGSFAIYLEPHHSDIMEFLELKKNHGLEEERARDLFYALWISDLFMERVKGNKLWSLFSPDTCPGLENVWGEEYKQLYEKYEAEGKAVKQIPAQQIWFKICTSQIETGTPYILYKDSANRKSNQQNYGTIKSSNLCTEILEYSDDKEYACCTLSSICLPSFLKADKTFDFVKLYEVSQIVTNNLNKVIEINYYPVPETELSNKRHRPLGIGVQGLADVFINMEIPFDSLEAAQLNKEIFAVIYYAGLHKSLELAKIHGTYETFKGSPLSEGKFQFDLWGTEPITNVNGLELNWQTLKEEIITHGVRNSLLLAPMPTASTSQIMGYNECFEPYTSFLYTRSTLAGQFEVVNHKLLRDLIGLGLWNKEMKNKMLLDDGSIQNIPEIPDRIKAIYKNSWDLSNKTLIDMSADRGAYVCQSQSLNLSIAEPTFKSLSSMHFYSWKKGLKTGIYYLRTKPKTTAQKFTVEPEKKTPQENALPCDSCSG